LTGLEEVGKEENKKLKTKLAPLVALLQNDDPETAMLASFALARVGGPLAIDAIPVLKRTLRDPDPKLQEQAATFLGEMGPDAADAAEALAEAIRPDRALAVRSRAAVALTKIGPDVVRVTPQLLETLRAKDATETSESPVRKYIAEVFVQMGYPNTRKAMPELLEVLADDTNMDVRHRCIWVFLSMEPRDFPEIRSKSGRTAEEVLTAALSDGDPEKTLMIRYTAARALAVNLGKKAPTKALDLLVDMLKNENLKIHLGAQSTVTSVGSEGTVGTTRSTDRQKGDARFLAAEALSFMGTTANRKDVVSALRKAATDTKDETGRLRTEAAKALKAIGVEP
jgi:HEAT repeat protein